MIETECLVMKENEGKDSEDAQRDDFLNDLELYEAERPVIPNVPNAICWHLTAIFKQRYSPTNEDDSYERQPTTPFCL